MKKSLLAFVLLLALVFAMQVFAVSCGDDDDDDDNDTTGDDDTAGDDDVTDDDTVVENPAIPHAAFDGQACMDCHADAHDGAFADDTADAECLGCHEYAE